jgi:CheY-like chemotaxis protein
MSDTGADTSPPILIVDDDPIVRALMRATLEVDGYDIIEADDGDEACALYETSRPQLLIADVVMPRMDGFTLCRELRKPAAIGLCADPDGDRPRRCALDHQGLRGRRDGFHLETNQLGRSRSSGALHAASEPRLRRASAESGSVDHG